MNLYEKNSHRFSLKNGLFSLIFVGVSSPLILSSCTGAPKSLENREVASVEERRAELQACFQNRAEERRAARPAMNAIQELHQTLGSVSGNASVETVFRNRSVEAQQALLAGGLEAAHREGEALVKQLHSLLDRGMSLQEVHAKTDVYARLLSLRIARLKLEEALREVSLDLVVQNFSKNLLVVFSGSEGTREAAERDFLRNTGGITRRLEFRDFGLEMAGEMEDWLGCRSGSTVEESLLVQASAPLSDEGARRPLPVDLRGYILRFVREFASSIKAELLTVLRSEPGTPRYRPDLGKPGNLTGDEFSVGTWAMTYDDGPAVHTEKLLAKLSEEKVPATFFVLSQLVLKRPSAMKTMVEDGHTIASHSYDHPNIPKLDAAGKKTQITDAVKTLETKIGSKTRFFRLPYGSGVNTESIRKLIKDSDLIHVSWNVDSLDWQIKTIDGIVENVRKQVDAVGGPVKGKGIILFHDIHERTVGMERNGKWTDGASLRTIRYLRDSNPGARFVTLSEIVDELNRAPGSR